MKDINIFINESLNINKISEMITKAIDFFNDTKNIEKIEAEYDEDFPDDVFGGNIKDYLADRQSVCLEIFNIMNSLIEENPKIKLKDLEIQLNEKLEALDIDHEFHSEYDDYIDFVEFAWEYIFKHPIKNDIK